VRRQREPRSSFSSWLIEMAPRSRDATRTASDASTLRSVRGGGGAAAGRGGGGGGGAGASASSVDAPAALEAACGGGACGACDGGACVRQLSQLSQRALGRGWPSASCSQTRRQVSSSSHISTTLSSRLSRSGSSCGERRSRLSHRPLSWYE